MQTRRTLLACLPVALAPAAAGAFRLEEATADMAAEYAASACSQLQAHEALLAELESRLDGRPLPPGLAPQLAELTRCPFCGCAVLGAADHGEAALAPRG